ncbi:hypothetical protein HD806DRAFT_529896 [Xylariaceae sp. AK1471]|nr:hypothetical protein HD806DRAFT_529896 [Xylariaceae sp. AK1471]
MSGSEAIYQCVHIYPLPEKWERVKALMNDIAMSVRDSEPGTLVYAVHEYHKESEPPVLIVWEKYENKEAQAIHRQNPKLAELVRQNSVETLIARPFEIMALTPMAGKYP